MTTRERRLKILTVPKEYLFRLLSWKPGRTVYVPVSEGVPDDAEAMDVVHDWQRQAFGVLLWHPSFPLVAEGCQLAWVEPSTYWCEADVVRGDDDLQKLVAGLRPPDDALTVVASDRPAGGYSGVPAEMVPALEAVLAEKGQVRGRDYTINNEDVTAAEVTGEACMTMRHIATVPVSCELLASILKFPPGTEIRGASDEYHNGAIGLHVEHPDLPAVALGCVAPRVYPVYRGNSAEGFEFAGWGAAGEFPEPTVTVRADDHDPA